VSDKITFVCHIPVYLIIHYFIFYFLEMQDVTVDFMLSAIAETVNHAVNIYVVIMGEAKQSRILINVLFRATPLQ
jgi:hypothetical protein